ncbi:hypothetical protein UlMin_010572 [Ulmus minor]
MSYQKGFPQNASSCRVKFARRFIKSLLEMKKSRPFCSSPEEIHKGGQRIKVASYSSMARAVGPRKAWSRAVLFKLQSRARHHSLMRKRCFVLKKKKRVSKIKPNTEIKDVDRLRELVPGGKAMDICSLFEETAHYIQCLSTQVKVMQALFDQSSK